MMMKWTYTYGTTRRPRCWLLDKEIIARFVDEWNIFTCERVQRREIDSQSMDRYKLR